MRRVTEFAERERDFTRHVSHELRTPLTVFRGAIELLEPELATSASRAPLERMKRAAHTMEETVEALLWLARESLDARGDKGEPLRVFEIVVDEVDEARIRGEVSDGVELLVEDHRATATATATGRLTGSPALLRIVVANLLQNALAHTREGRVLVELHSASVVIEDTGTGMTKVQRERAREMGASWRPGGTGIGLALLEQICQRLGWELVLDSPEEAGAGTRVVLRFGQSGHFVDGG